MIKLTNITVLTLYCSLIFWLSSRSTLPAPMLFEHQDKIHHMGAYFIMGIIAWRFFSDYISNTLILFVVALCYCSIYGISDEWHQSFVPGRDADNMDWLADTIGAAIALTALSFQKTRLTTKRQAS